MLRFLMLLPLLGVVPHGPALPAINSLPAEERLQSCDPAIAIAAAEEITRSPASLKEPLLLFSAASVLFHHGRKDDGVFWLYAAQLRMRQQLVFEQGDRAQLMTIMLETAGKPINAYAFQDTRRLDRILQRVLQWDSSTPNPFKDKAVSADERKKVEEVYGGFAGFRALGRGPEQQYRNDSQPEDDHRSSIHLGF